MVNLAGADLRYANLGGADLIGARANEHTILSKGYKVVDGYVVREELRTSKNATNFEPSTFPASSPAMSTGAKSVK